MLEIDKYVDDDDFGGLYLDVGVKSTTCALPEEEKEEEKLDSSEPLESDSESEDGLNIVLNDDDDADGKAFAGNFEANGDDFGYENDENDGGMGNDDDAQLKPTRPYSQSSVCVSGVKSNVLITPASYCEDKTRGSGFSSGSQRWDYFTLPRHRTILDFNIDVLEWKPWRNPGADMTDYFNFSLNEDSWKSYSSHLNHFRGYRSDVNGYSAYNPSRHTKEGEVGSEHKLLAGAAGEIDTQTIGALSPSYPKGQAIEVKEGIGERQPSVGVWHPVERGTGVIIQIPLQESEEDLPASAKEAVDGKSRLVQESSDYKESGDVAQCEGGVVVCFGSPSEGRLPCFDSASMVSVGHDSEAGEHEKLGILESCSDVSSEAIRSFSDPDEDASGIKPLTSICEKDLETTDAENKFSSPSLSSSRSYSSASRNGAYVEADRVHGHLKKASPTSLLEVHDTVRRVNRSSRDSERKSGHSTNFSRSNHTFHQNRSPIRRNHAFHRSRSPIRRNHAFHRSRSPIRRNHEFHQSRSPIRRNHEFHRIRSPIRRNHAFPRSRYRRSRTPIRRSNKHYQERSSRMGGLKSFPGNQDSWYVNAENELHELPHHTIGRFTVRNRHQGFNHFKRQDLWHDKESEESFYRGVKRLEDRLSVEEMDPLHYDYAGEFNGDQLPILDHRKLTSRSGKLGEMHSKRRRRFYNNDHSLENYNAERDLVEREYDRLLPHPQKATMEFDLVHGNISNQDWENQKVRHSGKPFLSSPEKYHNADRIQDRGFERYSESNLSGWDAAAFHDDMDTEHFEYQDGIEHLTSGVILATEDSDFQPVGTLNPVKGTLRGKRFGFVHDHEGKLIGYDYKQNRYKRLRKGNNDSQFLQNSNFTQRAIIEQSVPGNWKSTDNGNSKSSRCFEGRGFMSNGRYNSSDKNDQPGQRISKDSNISDVENTVRAGKDATSDIEEGQLAARDFDEQPKDTCKNPRILEVMAKMEKRQERFKQPLVNVSEKNDNAIKTMDRNTEIQRPARKRKWISSRETVEEKVTGDCAAVS